MNLDELEVVLRRVASRDLAAVLDSNPSPSVEVNPIDDWRLQVVIEDTEYEVAHRSSPVFDGARHAWRWSLTAVDAAGFIELAMDELPFQQAAQLEVSGSLWLKASEASAQRRRTWAFTIVDDPARVDTAAVERGIVRAIYALPWLKRAATSAAAFTSSMNETMADRPEDSDRPSRVEILGQLFGRASGPDENRPA